MSLSSSHTLDGGGVVVTEGTFTNTNSSNQVLWNSEQNSLCSLATGVPVMLSTCEGGGEH